MDQMQKPSRRLLWVGIAGVVLLIIVIITVAFILVGSTTKPAAVSTVAPSEETVASRDKVKQNIATLDASVKQAAADQAAAKAALKANEKQIKIGS
ncbi:MAG: hypothetical protein JWN75_189 [Candidatus Saccharibacteria bacterium]|nr:hypothetical protein [Candidatus Saccharibacteria bacterium]